MVGIKKIAGLAILIALAFSQIAQAQPTHLQKGSVLVYPLFDSRAGAGNIVSITNTNADTQYCTGSDQRAGDIGLHYVYIDGEEWAEFDRYEFLTAGDTLSVVTTNHNEDQKDGFLVVSAVDPTTWEAVSFDHLIGSSLLIRGDLNFLWSYSPYVFAAVPNVADKCNLPTTDADGDSALDFDGIEYVKGPEKLYLDKFISGGNFSNELTLMSTAGAYYSNEVDVLFWNNEENKYSRSLDFICWTRLPLNQISNIADALAGNPDELGVNGVETGWVSFTGRRVVDGAGNPVLDNGSNVIVPPLMGVILEFVSNTDFAAGHALHFTGTLDALEVPTGNSL